MAAWTRSDRRTLRREWPKGTTRARIKALLGGRHSEAAISRKANAMGLPARRTPFEPADDDAIRKLWPLEFSTTAIGLMLSPPRSGDEVRLRADALDLPRRGSAEAARPRDGLLDGDQLARFLNRAAIGIDDATLAVEFALKLHQAQRLADRHAGQIAALRERLGLHRLPALPMNSVRAVMACLRAAGDHVRPPDGDAEEEDRRWFINWRRAPLEDLVRRANTWRAVWGLPPYDVPAVLADAATASWGIVPEREDA